MKTNKWIELIVGVFTLAGIAAVAILVFEATNYSEYQDQESYAITASFDNVSGVKVRSAITMSGVTIGRVSKIKVDPQTFEAIVTLNIDKHYSQIPMDSSISIFTAGLLGEKYLGIEPGGAPDYLVDGSHVTLTQSSLVLEKLISQFLFSKSE